MRWIRPGLILIIVVAVVSVTGAQEDLGWLLDLIPTGDTIDLEKQLEQGAIQVVAEENVLLEEFSALNAWQSSSDREGNRRVRNERYEIRLIDNDIIYTGLGTVEYTNSIITVDTQRLSEEPNDGYGLVCRASDEDNGVHFYISSDGYWRIFAFEDGRARPFMPWTASDLINQGADARNQMTAVCVNDYYALYINGVLAGEARDSNFTEGVVGMSVIVFEEESEVFIAFDNLRIWSASSDAEAVTVVTNTESDSDEQRAETLLLLENGGEDVSLTSLVFYDNMEEEVNWETVNSGEGDYDFDDGVVLMTSEAGAGNPIFLATESNYDNVVLQAGVTFEDGAEDNAFGLTCRTGMEESIRGYQFVISADGYYTIWITDGVNYRFAADWERDTAINTSGTNLLTVVCIEDYFAFYANDVLLIDFYDDVFLTGRPGLMIYNFDDDDDSTVSFDNVYVREAELR